MNARTLLDADMRTIGQSLLRGWRWWADELRGLVPARLGRARTSGGPRFAMEQGVLVRATPAKGRAAAARAGALVTIVVPRADCLVRTIVRPAIGERDLQHMVAFEAEALLPIPPEAVLVAARAAGPAEGAGKIRIEVAGLPVDKARMIVGAAVAAGATPAAILLADEHPQPVPLDFAPAMRDAGLLARRRSATPLLWALVAILLLLNVATWIWRDAVRVARFEQMVAAQQPAMGIAQTIARRGEQDRRLIAHSLALRRIRDPLRAIAVVSEALPPGAWLQRVAWDGVSVRLTGYRPARADVATALRKSGHFAEVRTMGEDAQATMPTGEPFDLSARVRPR